MLNIIVLILLSFQISQVFAFKLSPMEATFIPSEGKITNTFSVTNDGQQKIAVQIKMAKRNMDLKGKEKLPSANDDFLIYPDQLIIDKKSKRDVKITWLKKNKEVQELAYRLIAEQIPVNFKSKRKSKHANIKILLKYIGAIYIDSPKYKSKVIIDNYHYNKSNKKIDLIIKNIGNKHKILKKIKIALKQKNINHNFTNKEMKRIIGENVLALSSRKFSIPTPNMFNKNIKYKITLNFDK